jgi:hypothetical protein
LERLAQIMPRHGQQHGMKVVRLLKLVLDRIMSGHDTIDFGREYPEPRRVVSFLRSTMTAWPISSIFRL